MPRKRTPAQIDPELCRMYLIARQRRDEMEKAMAMHRAAIEAAMGELSEFQTGPYTIRRASYLRSRLDQVRLKQDNPGIAEQYTTQREVRTFDIKLDTAAVLGD